MPRGPAVKDERAARARYAAERTRRGTGRNGAYVHPIGGKHPAHVPKALRKRVLFPLFFLIFALGTGGYLWWMAPVTNQLTGEQKNRGDQLVGFFTNVFNPELPLRHYFNDQSQLAVLLVGLDHVPRRKDDPNPPRRSDSVLLATTDLDTKQIRLLSIPRDSWVEQLSGRNEVIHDKLAHSYTHGQEQYPGDNQAGIRNTSDAVRRLTGIQPQYFVVIQFEGLAKLVDGLGGLTVDVEKRMEYHDRAGNLHIDFKPGVQDMNGEQVVQYARFRKDVLGDISRMGRQQKVIVLLMDKLRQPENLAQLPTLIPLLQQAVVTNFTPDQLLAFTKHMEEFPHEAIKSQTLQSYGNHEKGYRDWPGVPGHRRMSVQVIDPADLEKATQFLLDLSAPEPPAVEGEAGNASVENGEAPPEDTST
jgi:LCP family protein required for cell wall assembly